MNFSRRPSIGFTLTETLVAVGVVAILLSIAVPVVSSTRRSANEMKSLVNLRSIGQSTETYINTYANDYPFGRGGFVYPLWTAHPFWLGFDVWGIDEGWTVLFQTVAPLQEHFETWLSPGADPSRAELLLDGFSGPSYSSNCTPSYHYSTSFVAEGRVWSGNALPDNALIHSIHVSNVSHPSNKVLMFDAERPYLTNPGPLDRRPILFADGSASLRLDSDASEPVVNPFRAEYPARRYLDTPDGVLGLDFR